MTFENEKVTGLALVFYNASECHVSQNVACGRPPFPPFCRYATIEQFLSPMFILLSLTLGIFEKLREALWERYMKRGIPCPFDEGV